MLALFPRRRQRRGAVELRARRAERVTSSRSASGRRSSSTPRADAARAGAHVPARRARTRSSSTGRRRSRTSPLMRLLAEEGLGADVSTLGELAFARRAGIEGGAPRRARQQQVGRGACAPPPSAGALVVLDALDEPARAAAAGVRRVLVRVTPGVEAETHEAIRTGHHGSKFGLAPDDALEAVRRARASRARRSKGLHVHVGSQLADARAHLAAVELARRLRRALPRRARLDAGARRPRRRLRRPPRRRTSPSRRSRARRARSPAQSRASGRRAACPGPRLIVEPGRSLVGPAAFTLYRVGAVKQRGRPPLRRGRRRHVRQPAAAALRRALHRAAREPRRRGARRRDFTIAGQALRVGRRADRAASSCPSRAAATCSPSRATGAYTLAMSSNYNGVPRPAAVLVRRRRGAADPPPRDGRRPARARAESRRAGQRRPSRDLERLHLTVLPREPADGRAARAPVRRPGRVAPVRPPSRVPAGGHPPRAQLLARYGDRDDRTRARSSPRAGSTTTRIPSVVPNTMPRSGSAELARDLGRHGDAARPADGRLLGARRRTSATRMCCASEAAAARPARRRRRGRARRRALPRPRRSVDPPGGYGVGANAVPAFVLDRRLLVSARSPRSVFEQAFARLEQRREQVRRRARRRGFGWLERGRAIPRTSHALAADGRVWLVDSVDGDRRSRSGCARSASRPAFVQLLDRHNRDCAAVAARLGVPHHVVPDALPGTPFDRRFRSSARRWWREVALWWPERRMLVVADAIGTVPFFRAGGEPVGVHPSCGSRRRARSRGLGPSTCSSATARACTATATRSPSRTRCGRARAIPRWLAGVPRIARGDSRRSTDERRCSLNARRAARTPATHPPPSLRGATVARTPPRVTPRNLLCRAPGASPIRVDAQRARASRPGRTSRGGAIRPASRTGGLSGSASGGAPNDAARRSAGASP